MHLTFSDNTCRIWNVFAKQEIISLDLIGAQLQEMKWDFTGSLLCTGLKNREYSIWDPRTVTPVSTWTVICEGNERCRGTRVRADRT